MIVVLGKIFENGLDLATKASLAGAKELASLHNAKVSLICFGRNQEELEAPEFVDEVYNFEEVNNPSLRAFVICDFIKNFEFSYIIACHNSFWKETLPQVAQKLDLPMLSDIVKVDSANIFRKFEYGGAILSKIEVSLPCVISVRQSEFSFSGALAKKSATRLEAADRADYLLERRVSKSNRPDLLSAKIIVSGGRAFGSRENFENLLFPLADKLGAGVGATRAAVDSGYAPNDWQVGQTGKVVSPELYIALGVSGAVQHIAGMKGSKFVVAINKDPNAPIFEHCDIKLVGDIFEVIPQLLEKL